LPRLLDVDIRGFLHGIEELAEVLIGGDFANGDPIGIVDVERPAIGKGEVRERLFTADVLALRVGVGVDRRRVEFPSCRNVIVRVPDARTNQAPAGRRLPECRIVAMLGSLPSARSGHALNPDAFDFYR
jgi:hypothetical protein